MEGQEEEMREKRREHGRVQTREGGRIVIVRETKRVYGGST